MAAIPTNVFLATGQYSVLPRMTTLLKTGHYQSHAFSTEFLAKSKKLESIGIVGKARIRGEVTRCSNSTKDDGHEAFDSLESQMALVREELKSSVPDDADPSIINALKREEKAACIVAKRRLEVKKYIRTYENSRKDRDAFYDMDLAYSRLVMSEEHHFFEIFHLQEVATKHSDLVKAVRKMMELLHSIIEHHMEEHWKIY